MYNYKCKGDTYYVFKFPFLSIYKVLLYAENEHFQLTLKNPIHSIIFL